MRGSLVVRSVVNIVVKNTSEPNRRRMGKSRCALLIASNTIGLRAPRAATELRQTNGKVKAFLHNKTIVYTSSNF